MRVDGHIDKSAYPSDRGRPGIMARLQSESWDDMTRAARASSEHPSSLDRWLKIARQKNPALSDAQATRLAEHLRREHYRKMQVASVKARQAARELAQLATESGDAPEITGAE